MRHAIELSDILEAIKNEQIGFNDLHKCIHEAVEQQHEKGYDVRIVNQLLNDAELYFSNRSIRANPVAPLAQEIKADITLREKAEGHKGEITVQVDCDNLNTALVVNNQNGDQIADVALELYEGRLVLKYTSIDLFENEGEHHGLTLLNNVKVAYETPLGFYRPDSR
jgi:hypothetical protein